MPSIPERSRNVMLVGDTEAAASRPVYEQLLATERDAPVRAVVLTYLRQPETYLERWQSVGDLPAEFVVVDARDSRTNADLGDAVAVETAAPNDLTRLGIHVSEFVDDWDGDVCFLLDSLSALLQFVDVETAYRFIHVLTSRMTAVEARAFYVFHPGQHDAQTASIFTQLADAALEHDRETDTWTLSTR
jgi:hypothetical protein